MGDSQRESHDFLLNGGLSKRKRVIFGSKWGILEEKTRDFCLNGGFAKKDRVIFGLNNRFPNRKRVIFGLMGVSRRENA